MGAQQPAIMATPRQQQQVQYLQGPPLYEQPRIEYQPSPAALPPVPERQALPMGSVTELRERSSRHEDERWTEAIREKHKFEERLRRVEQGKDRELADSGLRERQLRQQLLETEQRHSQTLAEMALSQALVQQPTTPAFDVAALQKIIAEVQSDRISKSDIKQLVEDAVGKQLSGVAKTSDIDSAASRMEKGLNNMPTGASTGEIQQAVQQELEKAVQKVARHMPAQRQSLEAPRQQVATSMQSMALPYANQSASAEIPQQGQDDHSRHRSSHQSRRLLPAPPAKHEGCGALTSAALANLPGTNVHETSRSKSRASVMPTAENALLPAKRSEDVSEGSSKMSVVPSRVPLGAQSSGPGLSEAALSRLQLETGPRSSSSKSRSSKSRASVAPSASNAITRVKHHESKPKMSSVSVQPSASNAMVRPGSNGARPQLSSAQAMAIAQAGGDQLRDYGGHQGIDDVLPDDFPDNASQVSTWQRQRASRPVLSDQRTVATLRPRNYRMGTVVHSPLRQVQEMPEDNPGDMALVRQSNDGSKKSRR